MDICVFGDSITWGAGDAEKGGWVERLKQYFFVANPEHHVYNLGIPGDTTTGLLKRFDAEAAAREPDVIVFAVGINDAQYLNAPEHRVTSIDDFVHHLDLLQAKAQRHTSSILCVGITRVDEAKTMPISWATDRFYTNDRAAEYDDALRNWCKEAGVAYVAMDDVVSLAHIPDGVHPDSEGHEAIFRRVLGTVEPMLS